MDEKNNEQPEQENEGQELKFEDALARLEKIVSQMEKGELGLQQMMQKFEEGMSLAKYCTNKLNETEKKIEVLMEKSQNEDQWQEVQDPATLTGQSSETEQSADATES